MNVTVSAFKDIKNEMRHWMETMLKERNGPRMFGNGDILIPTNIQMINVGIITNALGLENSQSKIQYE